MFSPPMNPYPYLRLCSGASSSSKSKKGRLPTKDPCDFRGDGVVGFRDGSEGISSISCFGQLMSQISMPYNRDDDFLIHSVHCSRKSFPFPLNVSSDGLHSFDGPGYVGVFLICATLYARAVQPNS